MNNSGTASQPIAVFDFGKTNVKMFVFAADLSILYEERCTPVWRHHGPYRVLDTEALWTWIQDALRRGRRAAPIGGIIVTTHGCTGALIGRDSLAWPIVDYESVPPAEIEEAFAPLVPDFRETFSPALPTCLNFGKQLFWIEETEPQIWARTEAIVSYPQFWCWKLGALPVSELTSLACHTHLWSPRHNDFSSLVYSRGWRKKFPEFAAAGAVIGAFSLDGNTFRVHNGVHDSNAALYLYHHIGGHHDCALVSTGTWVVAFNPHCPHEALKADRDMLTNITVNGKMVPTARFMGGREFALLTENTRVDVTEEAIERVIREQQFALPSFAAGGPFPRSIGRLIGPAPESAEHRAAIASLYLACMTSTVLDLLHSNNSILFDGGLTCNAAYLALLAALRSEQKVLRSNSREGTAAGAAAIAYAALGDRPTMRASVIVEPLRASGLASYYRRWRRLCEAESVSLIS
jgi:sugar (pentulose or hexulose) kinase